MRGKCGLASLLAKAATFQNSRKFGVCAVPQPPEVLAMVLCDLVITDADTNKKSLIGLFDRVETAALPCVVQELHVYLSLTDGHGRMTVAIGCVAADDGEELFRAEALVEFVNPLQVIELHFVFPQATFPREGQYLFQFLADGRMLRERRFFVSSVGARVGDEVA